MTRLAALQRKQLALIDVQLPGANALALIDEDLSPAEPPTILMLLDGQENPAAQALDRAGGDYLVQPFSPTAFEACCATERM